MTEADDRFESLLHYLRDTRGFDFTGYKRTSLQRRIARRLQEVRIDSYEAYLDYLQVHPDEFGALFNTILINVTDFFRDAEAWQHLREEVLPALLSARSGQPIRAWSAGCASGQEAYSLAILLAEAMGADDFRDRVKIYATDVDEDALSDARRAVYREKEVAALTEEQVERYFERQGDQFAFRNDLRRSVIFGRNDLVQDAPISRIDILLCRNTLMYFNAETQARILRRLHFALNPGGVLFLGKAEMLLSHGGLFEPIDAKRRFFRKVAGGPRQPPLPVDQPEPFRPSDRPASHALARFRESFDASSVAQIVLDAGGRLAAQPARRSGVPPPRG